MFVTEGPESIATAGWEGAQRAPITSRIGPCENAVNLNWTAVSTGPRHARMAQLGLRAGWLTDIEHWYEAHGIGKKEFKRKRYLDET